MPLLYSCLVCISRQKGVLILLSCSIQNYNIIGLKSLQANLEGFMVFKPHQRFGHYVGIRKFWGKLRIFEEYLGQFILFLKKSRLH